MFNMAGYAEIKRLLAELEAIEERLMPNELEMLRSLKAKYTEPLTPDPFGQTSISWMMMTSKPDVAWPGASCLSCRAQGASAANPFSRLQYEGGQ